MFDRCHNSTLTTTLKKHLCLGIIYLNDQHIFIQILAAFITFDSRFGIKFFFKVDHESNTYNILTGKNNLALAPEVTVKYCEVP